MKEQNSKLLRHIVLFRYTAETSNEQIKLIEHNFKRMQSLIPEIYSIESGGNNSPEGLSKGFSHVFLLGFESEPNRDLYLSHPVHEEFKKWLADYLEDVLVFDFWS